MNQTISANDWLPIAATAQPDDQATLAERVRAAYAADEVLYPIGGATALSYGLPAKRPGTALHLGGLQRVVDYPARDMTITVESGITIARLAEILAGERQQLPIDVPQAEQATLGGLIATNHSGPHRFGYGTMRDYVIGIHAIDGRGAAYKGGGRVVKNVAGYDFCKLLTGSLGTLGVISQVTLKVRPMPESRALLVCPLTNWHHGERLLAGLAQSRTTAVAVEVVSGVHWQGLTRGAVGAFMVALEGTEPEVRWMLDQLTQELSIDAATRGVDLCRITGTQLDAAWSLLTDFPAVAATNYPLVLRARLLSSRLVEWLQLLNEQYPDVVLQAHAGDGIVTLGLAEYPAAGLAALLSGPLGVAARSAGGDLTVLASSKPAELTADAVWGRLGEPESLMTKIKQQFDPKNLLNPGRMI